jgi:hypothetical protein
MSAVYNPFARGAAVKDLSFTAFPSDVGQKGKTETAAAAWANSGQSGAQSSTPRISTDSMGTLLQQQDSGVNKWNDAPTQPRQTPSGEPALMGFGYYLSSGEKEMFTAATGFTFDSIGGTIGPDGKVGEPPGRDIMDQIGLDRQAGLLKGSVTPESLREIASRVTDNGGKVDQAMFDKALDYLAKNQH